MLYILSWKASFQIRVVPTEAMILVEYAGFVTLPFKVNAYISNELYLQFWVKLWQINDLHLGKVESGTLFIILLFKDENS